jgi:hypothetical protein
VSQYALFDLVRPAGTWALPAEFEIGVALDAQARADYARAEYTSAADLFMRTARLLLQMTAPEAYVETLRGDRMGAYENAANAWAMADMLDLARRELGTAAHADGECAEFLQHLLEHLPQPARG